MKTTTPSDLRHRKPADKAALKPAEAAMARTEAPNVRFKTVLVPSCGWPTEASVPIARKRITKR